MSQINNKVLIGRIEHISIPLLSIDKMKVKVDTGAKTSSLHVENIREQKEKGTLFVLYDIHPDSHNVDHVIHCKSVINAKKTIKSSNGSTEQRYFINTGIILGELQWTISITLTDRSDMNYLMLLGREALGEKFLVDPARTFIHKLA